MAGLVIQWCRFLLVGLINTGVGLSVIYLLMYQGKIDPLPANFFGYLIGIGFSFVLNKAWTFNNKKPSRNLLPQYIFLAGLCYGLNLVTVASLIYLLGVNSAFAQLCGIVLYSVLFFLGARFFVFKE